MLKLTDLGITLLWATALLIAGCAGMEPYDPPDYGETPPGRGLFTGPEGEFVIYQKSAEAESSDDANKITGQK